MFRFDDEYLLLQDCPAFSVFVAEQHDAVLRSSGYGNLEKDLPHLSCLEREFHLNIALRPQVHAGRQAAQRILRDGPDMTEAEGMGTTGLVQEESLSPEREANARCRGSLS